MTTVELFYKDKEFIEPKKLFFGGEIAKLEFDKDKNHTNLSFSPTINIIDKKIAERLVQSVCKSGFLLESGEIIGIGYTLEIRIEE